MAILFIVSSITERGKLGYTIGLITASYAFGAVAFSMVYPFLFSYFGFINGYIIGLVSLSSIVMIGLISFKFSNVHIKKELDTDTQIQFKSSKIILLWFGYFLTVFSGLMTIGHAVPLIISFGGPLLTAISSITMMTLGSAFAGIYAGWLVDRYGCKRPLLIILLINCLALTGLVTVSNVHLLIVLLVTISSIYGAVIAIYPTLVNHLVGNDLSAKIYGRVFTAWGAAGLISPSLAGWLFEKNNNYDTSILFAASVSVIAVLIIWKMKYTVN